MTNSYESDKMVWSAVFVNDDRPVLKPGCVSPTFDNYLPGFHINKSGDDIVKDQVREPQYSKEFSQLLQAEYQSKKRIDSARAAYGFKYTRDILEIDPSEINKRYGSLLELRAEGEYTARLAAFEPEEPSLDRYSADICLPESIHRDIARLADFMGANKQTILRQLMYIPIVYHSREVFLGERFSYWREKAKESVNRFEEDIENRLDELDRET